MPDQDARKVLAEENQLLDKLAGEAQTRASQSTGLASQILGGWAGSFNAYRERNQSLIDGDDQAFDKELDEEARVIEALSAAIKGHAGTIAESWQALFSEELEIIRRLR